MINQDVLKKLKVDDTLRYVKKLREVLHKDILMYLKELIN